MSKGWAVIENGSINVNTVSSTRRAAIVNWLVVSGRMMVAATADDHMIEQAWNAMKGGRAIAAEIEVVSRKYADIIDLPIGYNDADTDTIGGYLRALLRQLWIEEDGFSGKRPFGNSGWKAPVEEALISGAFVNGKLDEEGFISKIDSSASDTLMLEVIKELR